MIPGTPPVVGQMIDLAIEEDLGRGDVTTRLCVPEKSAAVGRVIAKQALTVSGLEIFKEVMKRVDNASTMKMLVSDGDDITNGTLMATVTGATRSLLMGERVALNYLQRLCGTATMARQYVAEVPDGCKVRLVDTRKTTPGMRYLERQAVLDGGGFNHRVDLGGGILIKENHIEAAGSVHNAVKICVDNGPHPLAVEVEVTNQDELREALDAGAATIMLDNMSPDQIRECLKIVDGRAKTEASGGINLSTVGAYAATGVDIISVGAFTHSAPGADISFLIETRKA